VGQDRFYKAFGILEGTGRDRERHPIAVRIAIKICVFRTALAVRLQEQSKDNVIIPWEQGNHPYT